MKKVVSLFFGMVMLVVFAACSNGTDNPSETPTPTPEAGRKGTVQITIPANAEAENSWLQMIKAYKQIPGNENVTVKMTPFSDSASYTDWLTSTLASGVQNVSADIVVGDVAGQYMKTHFVDLLPYLSTPNPYASNAEWKSVFEQAAYRTYSSESALYTLSADTTQVFFVYRKDLFAHFGKDVPETWDELEELCDFFSKTQVYGRPEKTYIPLALGGNPSAMGLPIGWLMRIYGDQYFRNYADIAHAQSTDYAYDPMVDADWSYKPNLSDYTGTDAEKKLAAVNLDNPESYTANVLRAYSEYFSEGGQNHKHAKYMDILENMKAVIGNPAYMVPDYPNSGYGAALGYFYADEAVMTVAATDFISAYAAQKGITPEEALETDLGVFYAPPMTDNPSVPGGAPDVNYTRMLGGPNGFFSVVNKSTAQTELVMDFMKYVFSAQGQQIRINYLSDNKYIITGTLLVKGVTVPTRLNTVLQGVLPTDNAYFGEADFNPFVLIDSGLRTYTGLSQSHTQEAYKTALHDYLIKKAITKETFGTTVYNSMQQYFPSFLDQIGYRADCLNDVTKNPLI